MLGSLFSDVSAFENQNIIPPFLYDIYSSCHLFFRILDITTILIGGGLSASFDYIMPSINKQLDYWLTPYYKNTLLIKKATLGNDAGLLGAASLCF